MYGNIGFTRREKYRERILNVEQRKKLSTIESELRKTQEEHNTLYDDLSISDEEIKEQEKQIEKRINELIEQICNIKYERCR